MKITYLIFLIKFIKHSLQNGTMHLKNAVNLFLQMNTLLRGFNIRRF